jgi:hypothetical protein
MRKVIALSLLIPVVAVAQHNHGSMMSRADMSAIAAHMEMSPKRPANPADSARAARLVTDLRTAIAKYRDVRIAVDDGYRQFAPEIKDQRIYHFTNYKRALANAFRFNPGKPTSLLYRKDERGSFVLVGAMFTAPKRASADKLDSRVPLSVAQWHKHINWCLPPKGEQGRWTEVRNGRPVFGPLGVSTKAECESAGGRFEKEVFGWMVHANVFAGDDPKVIWGEEHGMSGDEMMDHRH